MGAEANLSEISRNSQKFEKAIFVHFFLFLGVKHFCPNLRQGYQLYQDILYAVKKRDQSLFEDCLNREVSGLPETYTTTLRTFKKFLPQIQNALHYSYSNGPLECLNNHIKVLKRNAYGFRSFYNFKLRIMIRHGKTFLTK